MRYAIFLGALLAATSARAAEPKHHRGREGFAGEACAAMALESLDAAVDADAVFELEGIDPALGRGGDPRELAAALERLGLVKPLDEAKDKDALLAALAADLAKGRVSAVAARAGFWLVVSKEGERLRVLDPDSADDSSSVSLEDLAAAIEKPVRVRFEKRATPLAGKKASDSPSALALAAHCRKLRAQLPDGFPVVIERPFVVTGDTPEVARIAEHTVRWAVAMLKKDFFARDPDSFIDVWLFDGKESYETHARRLFGDSPDTPYGYYSPRHEALVMNIATGTGTLVHEIVHPFVRANFPECPAWLNEGLASLFEQCEEKEGHIHGRTNWRLAGLKKAIERGTLWTLEKLASTTTAEFYDDRADHYAQARYLCYYLQEKGLLTKFWKRFQDDRAKDPTGYASLVATLGEDDMPAFENRFKKWALALTFP